MRPGIGSNPTPVENGKTHERVLIDPGVGLWPMPALGEPLACWPFQIALSGPHLSRRWRGGWCAGGRLGDELQAPAQVADVLLVCPQLQQPLRFAGLRGVLHDQ